MFQKELHFFVAQKCDRLRTDISKNYNFCYISDIFFLLKFYIIQKFDYLQTDTIYIFYVFKMFISFKKFSHLQTSRPYERQ